MKKTLLTLTAVAAVATPVVLAVSCGSKGKNIKNRVQDGNEDGSGVTNPKLVDERFSTESLRQAALSWSDTPDNAVWTNGITNHALSETVSFIRNFANKLGYDSVKDVNGKTAKDNFLESTNNSILINDDNKDSIDLSKLGDGENDAKFLKSLSFDSSKGEIANRIPRPIIGDDGLVNKQTLDDFHMISSYGELKGNTSDSGAETVESTIDSKTVQTDMNSFSIWNDYSHPGQGIMQIHAPEHNLFREINSPLLSQRYVSVKEDVLKSTIIPAMHDALVKFFTVYKTDTLVDLAKSMINDKMFLNILEWMSQKLSDPVTGEIKIDNNNLTQWATEWNQTGSAHWLAMLAFYYGFDNSFSSGNYAPFCVQGAFSDSENLSGMETLGAGIWSLKQPLPGLNEMTKFITLTNWAHRTKLHDKKREASSDWAYDFAIDDGDGKDQIKFIASKTIDELWKPYPNYQDFDHSYLHDLLSQVPDPEQVIRVASVKGLITQLINKGYKFTNDVDAQKIYSKAFNGITTIDILPGKLNDEFHGANDYAFVIKGDTAISTDSAPANEIYTSVDQTFDANVVAANVNVQNRSTSSLADRWGLTNDELTKSTGIIFAQVGTDGANASLEYDPVVHQQDGDFNDIYALQVNDGSVDAQPVSMTYTLK